MSCPIHAPAPSLTHHPTFEVPQDIESRQRLRERLTPGAEPIRYEQDNLRPLRNELYAQDLISSFQPIGPAATYNWRMGRVTNGRLIEDARTTDDALLVQLGEWEELAEAHNKHADKLALYLDDLRASGHRVWEVRRGSLGGRYRLQVTIEDRLEDGSVHESVLWLDEDVRLLPTLAAWGADLNTVRAILGLHRTEGACHELDLDVWDVFDDVPVLREALAA